jgi:hypothetical protein
MENLTKKPETFSQNIEKIKAETLRMLAMLETLEMTEEVVSKVKVLR